MRYTAGFAYFIFVIGALPDALPTSCGAVGAKSYTPPAVSVPAVVLDRGTVITVTNATVAVNGDTSSVAALVANPGSDGISIQEAIIATNNDPGIWNIQFAPALKGSTIVVDPGGSGGGLSFLTGGNVTINGDIDGDGKPDITLKSQSGTALTIFIISAGNTIYGLSLQGCGVNGCVTAWSPRASVGLPVATGKTFSNTTISNLVMTVASGDTAIQFCPNCGENLTSPTGNTWDNVLITGNTITGGGSGPLLILVGLSGSDTVQHTIIANNNIVGGSIGIGVGGGLGDANNRALDTLIANNVISGGFPNSGLIKIGAGGNSSNVDPAEQPPPQSTGGDGGSNDLIDGMQIIGNQLHVASPHAAGISLSLGDTPSDGFRFPVIQYAENNIARNISIVANTIDGAALGIGAYAGSGTARNDLIANVSILGNTLTGGTGTGVSLEGASSFGSPASSSGNTLSNILIQANSIQVPVAIASGPVEYELGSAGILLQAGWMAPSNGINSLSIANNDVDTPLVGINVVGGWGVGTPTTGPLFPASNNVVSAVQIYCNQLDQAPQAAFGVKGINVTAGVDVASGNQVRQLLVVDNLVGGVLGGASLLSYLGGGGSGNTISTSAATAPWPEFMPAGLVNGATFQQEALVPGSLVSLFGLNLNGATVQFDTISAPVLYSSSSQLNLQVPWELQGKSSTSVTATANNVSSAPQAFSVGLAAPGIFSLGAPQGGQGAITNAAGVVVNANSPAHAGDYLEIYCNGLGAVSNTPQTGTGSVASPLSRLIGNAAVTIGGVGAPVSFAGLTPGFIGLYQVNVQVPQGVVAGDGVPVVVTTGGISSNAVSISVR
jgi:uncharacterized protein (TIGR03437 family)